MLLGCLLFLIFCRIANGTASVISIENYESESEWQEVPIVTNRFLDWLTGTEKVCIGAVNQTNLDDYFEKEFSFYACSPSHKRVSVLAETHRIDWETFRKETLKVPDEFPEYKGYLLVDEVVPKCSDRGDLVVRLSYRVKSSRTFGRPQVFRVTSFADCLYQFYLNSTTQIASSSHCEISGDYGRCWQNASKPYYHSDVHIQFAPDLQPSEIGSRNTAVVPYLLIGLSCAAFFIIAGVVVISMFLWRSKRVSPESPDAVVFEI